MAAAQRLTRGVRAVVERGYFALCLALGWILRRGRYSRARVVRRDGDCRVRKRRLFYASLLIWTSGPLVRLLDTGVRILPQRDWEERERRLYSRLYGASIHIDADGTLVLPCLPGRTLAAVLEDPKLDDATRRAAIAHATAALARFHLESTHGDAMAENVLVDLEGGAYWFDFETEHAPSRSPAWRRADDLRALIATCLIRTAREKFPETLQLILDAYQDDEVARAMARNFTAVLRRSLSFHLAQAGLSFQEYRDVADLLQRRRPSTRR